MMMKFLRTASRQRLLATLAGMVIVVLGGTAIAVAAAGSGPVPPAKPLAQAIHDGLAAPPVQGIIADVSFTNHLVPASSLGGSNPILSGATGRLWLSSDHRLRLELQSANGDAQVVVNGSSFWVYEPSSKTVYEGSLPAGAHKPDQSPKSPKEHGLRTVAQIQSELNRLAAHLNLSGAQPSDVAGQPAYTVRVSPRHDGGLLGAAELAWDSVHGVPLRFAVYAQNAAAPVIELKATSISFGPVAASTFDITPPSGAKVVKVQTRGAAGGGPARGRHARHREITGTSAVARALPFALEAPGQLVGLPRRSVKLLDWGGHPAALVTYGQNLGGVAVIEQSATHARTLAASGGNKTSRSDERRQALNLPTVSVNGVTGQELDTALGTMVRFTRGGVSFTVIGSVPPAAADAAARGL